MDMDTLLARDRKPSVSSRSGAAYKSLYSPWRAPDITLKYSSWERDEFMYAAGMPDCKSAPTWSFIREIRGDITSVSPGSIRAGSW